MRVLCCVDTEKKTRLSFSFFLMNEVIVALDGVFMHTWLSWSVACMHAFIILQKWETFFYIHFFFFVFDWIKMAFKKTEKTFFSHDHTPSLQGVFIVSIQCNEACCVQKWWKMRVACYSCGDQCYVYFWCKPVSERRH